MKLRQHFLNEFKILWIILFFLLLISFLGQYSAFSGTLDGQVQKHLIRMIVGIAVMWCAYIVDFKIWSNLAYAFYAFSLISLMIVDLLGTVKLGAQRWIDLYFFTFQPSELMKLALILALARYYSMLSALETVDLKCHISPIFFTLLPVIWIAKQPDLGTAGLLLGTGFVMIFLTGFPQKIFTIVIISLMGLCPLGWFFLHDYQKNRILTFLAPDRDPLGAGYNILQSKIAIGSGHVWGRGFLQGTQSKLNFLPEKNTDFIFTTIAEESGFFGSLLVLCLFLALCGYFFWAASETRTKFSKLICYGLGTLIFLHVFVNIAMVIGLLPIVGIPLPFLSYGGSSMITFMISCGLVMSAVGQKKR
ncbi:MAG: rod shape-determining protein RodA [Holosporaceae bacterium]|jgi:rod shape determining protein RodA|nr:rod shape-determining protein RodA [Holosporaceae bacterium]